ncbi:YeeE/YedE family protein [Xanthomonas campestris]|uniref:YeeE/YedE family protein n=1 Tax=Xanthomonas campestris TaxID=339 RepID=UPI0023783324|nr:DUF6691 family protein [Xanthomonas campestris]
MLQAIAAARFHDRAVQMHRDQALGSIIAHHRCVAVAAALRIEQLHHAWFQRCQSGCADCAQSIDHCGAALFGIGWGIAGYCPGPALAGLGVASVEALWFVPAMLAGSALHWAFNAPKQAKVDR